MKTKGERLFAGLFWLVIAVAAAACSSDDSSGDSGDDESGGGGGTSGGGTGGSGAAPAGTGLPSGTACVLVGTNAERCSASGNLAWRTVNSGNISISVSHPSAAAICQAGCNTTRTCADPAAFTLGFTMPEGLTLPYQKTGTQASGFGSLTVNDGVCVWNGMSGGFPIMGTVFQDGTRGAANVEADISVQTLGANCLPAPNACPNVTARIRFNLPL